MTWYKDQLRELLSDIDDALEECGDPEVVMWAVDRMADLQPRVNRFLSSRGYENHVHDYVNRERDRFRGDAEDVEEKREKLLCTCRDPGCPLKTGNVPRQVSEADSLDDGVLSMKESHGGRPLVLEEALEEWLDDIGEVLTALRRVRESLQSEMILTDDEF